MLILRDPKQLTAVPPEIQIFLHDRFEALSAPEIYDPDEHGFFILVEAGDTPEQIESATGYSLLKSLFNGTAYDDPDFTPDCECLEDHGSFYEAVFIYTDSGYAVIMIVPKLEGIDDRLLAICSKFAIKPLSLGGSVLLDCNAREYYEERAGIAEFEAGMSRAEAEQFALALTLAKFKPVG